MPGDPYDRWVSPAGVCMAEFYRHESGYYLRFPGQADFLLADKHAGSDFLVTGWPVPECDTQTVTNLYHNAIQPILGNHSGGIFLHGSAVKLNGEEGAIAFLGLSRGGKTTLAGSFASAGHPFLTEDVIDLAKRDGQYWLQPKRSKLRLFIDSARHLIGGELGFADEDRKQDVDAGDALPFSDEAVPLRQIFVLGTDHLSSLSIRQFSLQEALTALMPHAFILDVEDKERLRGHFARMAGLAQDVGCYALDYTRDYAELPRVKSAILDNFHAG
ncbi:hypothetical protein [uncultured Erythrobacter sp.]|uniref:hypothetical protein n=1 Tax=uncultured Erythrobacter sp. TaxID=263913 RepID=UPI002633EC9B|nr:hypothetical protein [uncultured Erythrobacter sp.]